MKTQFSLFDGFLSIELPEPFDYLNDFMNEQFAFSIFQSSIQTIHFHCCIFPENVDISEDKFLTDFFQKLPFATSDVEKNTTHFWWHTPELRVLLQNKPNTFDAEILAQSLLDSMLNMFSVLETNNQSFLNLNDIQTVINNSKKAIAEKGFYKIRETYRLNQENDFKNKYWI